MDELKAAILEEVRKAVLVATKQVLTLKDVVALTGLSKTQLQRMMCEKQIPYYKPRGKNAYFDKDEINDWLRRNKQEVVEDTSAAAVLERYKNS